MPRLTTIEARYSREIGDAAGRFGDHEDMNRARVLRWMSQFSNPHLNLASKVLRAVRYYGAVNIRAMTRQLLLMVLQEFDNDPTRIIFVPIGDVGSGSGTVARALRDVPEIRGSRIASMSELNNIRLPETSGLAFIDDFSGTGDQLSDWWHTVESLVRPVGASIVIGLLVMTAEARARILQFADRVLSVDELTERDNVLSTAFADFDATEKQSLLRYCRRTGVNAHFVQGYGSCGLLITFKHGCPNNSLPILWCDSSSWRALFKRRAI